jgi:FkbM family methyltransferase
MQHILGKLLDSPDKTFVDVGVNLGQTLLKVKAVNRQINYIGFEPNPFCVNYVSHLIEANAFTNTDIWPVGLSGKTEMLNLNLFSDSNEDSAASVIDGFRIQSSVKKMIKVPVFEYADLNMDESTKFDVIKIDVEGAELEVLEGLSDKIRQDRPVILMEILPPYSIENRIRIQRQEKITSILKELKYSILRIMKENEMFIGLQPLDDFGIHSDMNLCEYVLVSDDRKQELLNL